MLDFSGNDAKTKLVALHYATQFDNRVVIELLQNQHGVQNEAEATALAKFFWDLLDASALDKENGVIVLDEIDLQFWVERLLNIIGGHLKISGYADVWDRVSDDA